MAKSDEIRAELMRRIEEARKTQWVTHTPTPQQRKFLALPHREALYGGAAGGGKSDALLMLGLEYVDVPGYAGILLRHSFTDLMLPGALIPRSHEWLAETKAHWNGDTRTWHFPAGSTLSFGYMKDQADHYRYQGSEFQFVGIDELTQHREYQARYLMSRLRRLSGSDVPVRFRGATNPGGRGHKWVAERYGIREDGRQSPEMAKIRPFVPAKLDDNPHLDVEEYRHALRELPSTVRDQLERGLWVQDTQGLIYPYTSDNVIGQMPEMDGQQFRVLAIDLGASQAKPTTAYVVLAWHPKVPKAVWVERSWARKGQPPGDMAEEILELRESLNVWTIVMDEGALGKGYGEELRTRWNIPVEPAQKQNKLGYRQLLRGALEQNELLIVRHANKELLEELNTLIWNEAGLDAERGFDDHLSDALLYGWRRCMAYASEAPEYRPAHGSPERDRLEMERALEAEREAFASQGEGGVFNVRELDDWI